MQTTIRFLRLNRYRKAIGDTDSQMGYGVHDALVQRGIAEWVENPIVAAVISEPVAATTETPKRRQRRSDTTEDRT